MRVSEPSTGGDGSCSARATWRAMRSAQPRRALRAQLAHAAHSARSGSTAEPFGAIVAQQPGQRRRHAGFEARIDAGIVGGEAAAAARHQRIFGELPLLLARGARQLLAHDGGVVGMQVNLDIARRQRQQAHACAG